LSPGSPSSWRDFADWLTFDQFYELRARERDGWNPGVLFLEARDLATRADLDG
jgi:hypothetical protein